jgi:hypothetical protein
MWTAAVVCGWVLSSSEGVSLAVAAVAALHSLLMGICGVDVCFLPKCHRVRRLQVGSMLSFSVPTQLAACGTHIWILKC